MRIIRFIAFVSGGISIVLILALSLDIILFTWKVALTMLPVIIYGLIRAMYEIIMDGENEPDILGLNVTEPDSEVEI